jgi:hypothetical protein
MAVARPRAEEDKATTDACTLLSDAGPERLTAVPLALDFCHTSLKARDRSGTPPGSKVAVATAGLTWARLGQTAKPWMGLTMAGAFEAVEWRRDWVVRAPR